MISVQEILLQSGSHVRCLVLGTVYWDTGAPGLPVPSPAPLNTERDNKVAHVLFWLFLESVSSDWTFGSQAFSLCSIHKTPSQVHKLSSEFHSHPIFMVVKMMMIWLCLVKLYCEHSKRINNKCTKHKLWKRVGNVTFPAVAEKLGTAALTYLALLKPFFETPFNYSNALF